MIRSFRHKGLERFFRSGSKAGIQPVHANRLGRLLFALDTAERVEDMDAPGFGLHALKGEFRGDYAVTVNGNWRLTFTFEGDDAVSVDYLDYH